MKYLTKILMIISAFLLLNCQSDSEYLSEIETWHSSRINSLQKDTGWLSLAGLHWLDEGVNHFGSSDSNEIVFPGKAPAYMGSFTLKDSIVTISIRDEIQVMSDSVQVKEMVLRNDNQKNTTVLTYKSFLWYIVKRSDKYGIRLKDKEHPNLKSFAGVERFPVDKSWRIKAKLKRYDPPKKLGIPNVLGQINESPCPGALVFKVNGKEYSLDPIGNEDSKRYWIIFSDETSAEDTYAGGRYLYVDAVDENDETFIDFNRSYNPPCVFSPFATCPLPPAQNKLSVKILAGEKMWKGSH